MRVVCRGAAIITSQTKMSSTQGDFAANQRAQLSRQFYCGGMYVYIYRGKQCIKFLDLQYDQSYFSFYN